MTFTIRSAHLDDAAAVSRLSAQLGYEMPGARIKAGLIAVLGGDHDAVYVALSDGQVIGWMQVSYLVRIESGAFCEVTGLVVDERARGQGAGKALLLAARDWAASKGCKKLRVRSNVVRSAAHRFYLAAGFVETKEQKIFDQVW